MLLDELADVVDRARGLRAAQQEQVLAVAGDPVERRAQARVVGELGAAATFGHPRPEDLLADVLDLDRAGLVRQVGERRLHRDEPVHAGTPRRARSRGRARWPGRRTRCCGPSAGPSSSCRCPGRRRSAAARRHAGPVPMVLSSGVKPERDGLVLGEVPGRDALVEVDQDIERRPRAPCCRCRCRGASRS